MKIKVTQEHIDKGNRLDPFSCPLALAMKEAGFLNIRVSGWSWKIDGENYSDFPLRVDQFHDELMRSRIPAPFEFELSV